MKNPYNSLLPWAGLAIIFIFGFLALDLMASEIQYSAAVTIFCIICVPIIILGAMGFFSTYTCEEKLISTLRKDVATLKAQPRRAEVIVDDRTIPE